MAAHAPHSNAALTPWQAGRHIPNQERITMLTKDVVIQSVAVLCRAGLPRSDCFHSALLISVETAIASGDGFPTPVVPGP